MNIKYYFKNTDSIDDETREYIEKKIDSVAKLITIEQTKVEIEKQKNGYYMHVHLDCGRDLFLAEEKDKSINVCIDNIENELKSQIRRNKKKNIVLKKRGARSIKKKLTIDENARL